MIPAISDNKYSWQDQEAWDEYEFLKMQIRESGMDPDELEKKIIELEKRFLVK